MELCKDIDKSFASLAFDQKLQNMNLFINQVTGLMNKTASLEFDDSMAVIHTAVHMLHQFALFSDEINEMHILVFYDNVGKLFMLLCRLLEVVRQVPGKITVHVLTAKAYCFIGLPGYILKYPDDISTIGESSSSKERASKNVKNTRPYSGGKKVRSLAVDPLLASLEHMRLESLPTRETSIAQSDLAGKIDLEKASTVRKNALHFMCLLLQNSTSSCVSSAWPVLLNTPASTLNSLTGQHTTDHSWYILSLLINDYSLVVRYMACSLVIELLDDGVKPFVSAAQDNVSTASSSALSFTPHFVQLGAQLKEIHRCLIAAALHANKGSGKSPQMVVHVVKALQFLVRLTPYNRLRPGLLSDIFKVCSTLLRSKDVDVRVACLSVFGEMLSNTQTQTLFEVECLVRSLKPPAFSRPLSVSDSPTGSISGSETPISLGSGFQPWLLKIALESAAPNSVYSYPVKIEALQLLKALIRFHASVIFFEANQLPDLFRFVYAALYSSDLVYLAHVCYVLETIGIQLNEEPVIDRLPLHQIVSFWTDALSNHIFRLLDQSSSSTGHDATLKAALLDALASMGSLVFDRLPANLRILSTTTPIDLAAADAADKSLRAAAIRCLGHLISFPSMTKDQQFIRTCVETSIRHIASEPACQCAAAWLLRNTVDNCLTNLPREYIDTILNKSISITLNGPDKAKPHTMTVIWKVISCQELNVSVQLAADAVGKVICPILKGKVKGPVKLQWNAADGLVESFKPSNFWELIDSQVDLLVDNACQALVQSPNFRTKTTLTKALVNLAYVKLNWSNGQKCLQASFSALSTVRDNITSGSELKHVDNFVLNLWLVITTWIAKLDGFVEDLNLWISSLTTEQIESVVHDANSSLMVARMSMASPINGCVVDDALKVLVKIAHENSSLFKTVISMLKFEEFQ